MPRLHRPRCWQHHLSVRRRRVDAEIAPNVHSLAVHLSQDCNAVLDCWMLWSQLCACLPAPLLRLPRSPADADSAWPAPVLSCVGYRLLGINVFSRCETLFCEWSCAPSRCSDRKSSHVVWAQLLFHRALGQCSLSVTWPCFLPNQSRRASL